MYTCHSFGKLVSKSNGWQQYRTLQFLATSQSKIFNKKPQSMNARWLHSSGNILSEEKHADTAEIKIKQIEQLPHFRETVKGTKQETVVNESGLSAPDENVHPDVLEGRSMQDGGYRLPHPIWTNEELESVQITHRPPTTKVDKLAYYSVKCMRVGFDVVSGYTWGNIRNRLDEKQWIKRIIFLETVAGVPGMVGAMVRHLVSLRKFKRDHGWIHTLLEEAENERMHLMTAMRIGNPGFIMKSFVMATQAVFVAGFSVAYFVSPRFCHRFVGYLEEEAVKTYTHCLKEIDEGRLKMWCRMKAPEIAVEYWKLPDNAMMRDVVLAIRADEAHHRTVNHTLSTQKQNDSNPYPPGQ